MSLYRDTVDSVGIFPKRLPFTTSNGIVRTFRHAVSLDERRSKFKTNLWNRPTDQETRLGVLASSSQQKQPSISPASSVDEKVPSTPNSPSFSYSSGKRPDNGNVGGHSQKKGGLPRIVTRDTGSAHDRKLDTMEAMYSASLPKKLEVPTDVEEVWFAVRYVIFLCEV
jgi:hypothetical protein